MTPNDELHHLAIAGDHLSEIAATADLSIAVPTCDGWSLERLITHCCQVWSLVKGSIEAGNRLPLGDPALEPTSKILSDWHAHAVTELHHLLSRLGPDGECWTFSPRWSTAAFWMRRMCQEATMHLWDARNALGHPSPIDPELAIIGIDEYLDHFIGDRRPDVFAGNGETLHFHATDGPGEWVITRTPTGIDVERTHAKGDVAARGPASDLLLFVWGRVPPSQLEVFGDEDLLVQWQADITF